MHLADTRDILLVLLGRHNSIQNGFRRFTWLPTNIVRQIVTNLRPRNLPTFISSFGLSIRGLTLVRSPPRILMFTAIHRYELTRRSVILTLRFNRTMTSRARRILINVGGATIRIRLSGARNPIRNLRLTFNLTLILCLRHSIGHVFGRLRRITLLILSQIMTNLRPG